MQKILLVTGSRSITDHEFIWKCLNWAYNQEAFDVLLHGNALGVDRLAGKWAEIHEIEVKKMEAQWEKYAKGAGKIRNSEMVAICDRGVAIWDGKSEGTKHCIRELEKHNKLLRVFYRVFKDD